MSLLLFAGIIFALFFWVKNNRETAPFSPNPQTQVLPTGDSIGNAVVLSYADERGRELVSLSVIELASHMAVIGKSGSGKTTSICAELLQNLLALGLPGIIFGIKPDDRLLVEKYARRTGRNLTIISRDQDSPTLNCIQYLLNRPNAKGMVSDVVELLFTMPSILQKGMSNASKGEQFWESSGRALLKATLNLLYLTGYDTTIDSIFSVIRSAPRAPEALQDLKSVKTSLCVQLILISEEISKDLSPDEKSSLLSAVNYFLYDYPNTPEVTRGSIEATVRAILAVLDDATVKRLCFGETSFLPEECMLDFGRVVFVDLPTIGNTEHRFIQGLIRETFKRAILSRNTRKYPAFMFMYADEYQEIAVSNDPEFFSTCRSQRVLNLIAFQTFDTLADALGGGETGKQKAQAILGNTRVKCFLQSDFETSTWMANQIGKEYKVLLNSTYGTSSSDGNNISSNGQRSTNSNDGTNQSSSTQKQRDHRVFPEEIMCLANGGAANGYMVEAYLLPGKMTNNKTHFLQITLAQDLQED